MTIKVLIYKGRTISDCQGTCRKCKSIISCTEMDAKCLTLGDNNVILNVVVFCPVCKREGNKKNAVVCTPIFKTETVEAINKRTESYLEETNAIIANHYKSS